MVYEKQWLYQKNGTAQIFESEEIGDSLKLGWLLIEDYQKLLASKMDSQTKVTDISPVPNAPVSPVRNKNRWR